MLTFIFILNSCHQVRFQNIIQLVTKDFKILPAMIVQHIFFVLYNTLSLACYQQASAEWPQPGTRVVLRRPGYHWDLSEKIIQYFSAIIKYEYNDVLRNERASDFVIATVKSQSKLPSDKYILAFLFRRLWMRSIYCFFTQWRGICQFLESCSRYLSPIRLQPRWLIIYNLILY